MILSYAHGGCLLLGTTPSPGVGDDDDECHVGSQRFPLLPPRGPVLLETGRAPAAPLLYRERISFTYTNVVSPAGSEHASKYETPLVFKKLYSHAASRHHRTPTLRHAPVAVAAAVADLSTRCTSLRGPSTRQLLRPRQHVRNRRLRH
jgi:hypothetical protein